jgi:predicted RNase H-like HicB family nuclease
MAKSNSPEKLKVIKGGVEYEIEPAEEGGYIASVPLYPSCVSQGETLEETLENIEDALLGCLAAAEELNLPIPKELQLLLRQKVKP